MASLFDRFMRIGEGKVRRELAGIAAQVNALEPTYEAMSDEELREETDRFREKLAAGSTLDDILPEAFAAVREASRRTLGQRHFDVQLQGGAALHKGMIAEMKTGEGKTLVATLPAYLNALEGKGVHVITVNNYLAEYQSELMGRIFRFLGLTTGVIVSGLNPEQRRAAYNADITYGTNNEFGFDYLRDNMATDASALVQRGHNFAIVDEVDSILIDEARTPLIISGPAGGDANKWYTEFARIARLLKRDEDYEIDEAKRTAGIGESGIEKVEDILGIENLYESLNTPLIQFLQNAIKAKELFKRDKDYVVMGGEVLIVDEHTGRMLPGRRYNEGMHQAIEAKEGVEVKAENQTFATITLQNYFRMYSKLAGMTGTAQTEAAEMQSTYKLGVVPIDTNKPMIRVDQPDLVYQTENGKWRAVVADIVERHREGQPVLVGTVSVEKSEGLSKALAKLGIPHEVLNAKQHEREASIVARAGRKGAVTVATNMAGRGTDIMLGGNAEFMAVEEMAKRGYDAAEDPEAYEAAWPDVLAEMQHAVEAEHDEVVELGGLYVLGTERHESRRIDNQLRGRSGRQGDPGESRFYLSMQDDLMRMFGSGLAESIMARSGIDEDTPLESKMVSRGIQSAQSQVESRNQEIRKNLLKYDEVMNSQRQVIYEQRRRVLHGEDLEDQIQHFITDVITDYVTAATATGTPESWDLEALWSALKVVFPVSITPEELIEQAGAASRLSRELMIRELLSDARMQYAERTETIGAPVMRELERRVVLSVLDRKWREHLYEMDYLKEGIGMRALAQRDPLVEYQREGYNMFQLMSDAIKEESVGFLFNLEFKPVEQPEAVVVAGEDEAPAPEAEQAAEEAAAVAEAADEAVAAPVGAARSAGGAAGASGGAGVSGGGTGGSGGAGTAAAAGDDAQVREPVPAGMSLEDRVAGLGQQAAAPKLSYSAPTLDGDQRPVGQKITNEASAPEADGATYPGTGRNAQCPCGSGKKYKLCHGRNE